MKVVSVLAQKGGTGKTATATHLAAALVSLKKRVLVIDLDPQTNLSQSYNIESDYTIYNFMNGDVEGFNLKEKEGIFFLMGDRRIWQKSYPLNSLEQYLEALSVIPLKGKTIDYVIIDCSPMPPLPINHKGTDIHLLNGVALYASNFVISPVNASQHSFASMIQLKEDLEVYKTKYKSTLTFLGWVINRYVDNRIEQTFWKNQIEEVLKESNLIFKSLIHESEEINKATRKGMSVFKANPNSRASLEFIDLIKEIVKKIK